MDYFSFDGIIPNMLLILIVSIAFCNGPVYGAVFGFMCGLLYDVLFGNILGFYSLLYVINGYLVGLCGKVFYDYNFQLKFPILLISISTLAHNLITYIFFFFIKGDLNFKTYLSNLIIPEIIYSIILGCVLFRFFFLLEQKLSLDERKADGYFVS